MTLKEAKKGLRKISSKLKPGDYVFATKYQDADPNDRWIVDFIERIIQHRDCKRSINFNDTGFINYWYAKKITAKEGHLIVDLYKKSILNSDGF